MVLDTPASRLRWARERAYDSMAEAARQNGWEIVTYKAHENGTNGVSPKWAQVYGKAFGVAPEWLLCLTDAPLPSAPARGEAADPTEAALAPLIRRMTPAMRKALAEVARAMLGGDRTPDEADDSSSPQRRPFRRRK